MKHAHAFTLALGALLLGACNISETDVTTPPDPDFAAIIEYSPAPGQFINDTRQAGFDGETTAAAACAYAEARIRARQYVSLGAWGGYLVARFDDPVLNDGGYNLLIQGNSISTSSEPGIVWVMSDENGNGEPDETWYELRGSEFAASDRAYEVTYQRPAADSDPVTWSDNRGNSGSIIRTVEHPQAYFPAWIEGETLTRHGTLLPRNVAQVDELWVAQPFEWGYVDNYSTEGRNLFRISDAVDAEGNPVSLQSIDFVKIQSGVMDQGELIGEVSTEITAIRNYNLLK